VDASRTGTKLGLYISRTVKRAHHLDPHRNRAVKDDVSFKRETAKLRHEVIPRTPEVRLTRQEREFCSHPVDKGICLSLAVFSDVVPNSIDINPASGRTTKSAIYAPPPDKLTHLIYGVIRTGKPFDANYLSKGLQFKTVSDPGPSGCIEAVSGFSK
jgi:hypothetical protein